jgi:hypothetical protein
MNETPNWALEPEFDPLVFPSARPTAYSSRALNPG